jgi:hypothetical protein
MTIADPASLELTADQMQQIGQETLAHIVAHVASLGVQPSRGDVDAADLCLALREPVPEHGSDLASLLDPLFNEWIPRSFTTSGPGHLAYIPGGGLYPAALADFISAATKALLERVTARGRVMITGCSIDGRYIARVCVLSFRSRQAHIDACVEDIAVEAAVLRHQGEFRI